MDNNRVYNKFSSIKEENMKILLILTAFCIAKIGLGQTIKVLDSETKEPIIGVQIIECKTFQKLGETNLKGEAELFLNEKTPAKLKLESTGYSKQLIDIYSDSIVELESLKTNMTLGTDGLNVYFQDYRNSIENSCPNKIEEIKGKWMYSVPSKERRITFSEISFSNDTILIFENHDALSVTYTLAKYKIISDTIITTEIEEYTLDTNIGFVKSHFKNRKAKSKIPLCYFIGGCICKDEIKIIPKYELVSLKPIIEWQDITKSRLYRKKELIKKDY